MLMIINWEQRKFKELVDRVSASSENIDLPRVEYEDIISGRGILNKDLSLKISDKKGTMFLPKDILFGKLRPYLNKWLHSNFKGIAVGDFWILRSKEVESKFIFYMIQTNKFKLISNISSGSKMPRSDWNIVSNSTFAVPLKSSEDRKIGLLLSTIENLITLHQECIIKINKILQMFQTKMFSNVEEDIPQIRNSKYDSLWDKLILGDIGKTFTSLSGKTKDDFGHGDAEYVPYLNVFNNPVTDISFTDKIEKDSRQKSLQYGDILFTTSSETPQEVGMSSVWLDDRPNVYLNSFCFGFRPVMKYDHLFLASLLRSDSFRKQMYILAQGVSRYNISKVKAMDIKIKLPEYEEQVDIGELFKLLNLSLELRKNKIKVLRELKETYLSKMFL